MHRKWKSKQVLLFFLLPLFILIAALAIGIGIYRSKTVVIELSLYSGNSWGVPQNFAYAIYDKAVELFEQQYADKGYRMKLRTGMMYKDYSEWFAQQVLKGKEPDLFLIIEEDFTTFAAIGLLEKLDSYIKNSDLLEDSFFSNALEAGQYQGSQYALPIGIVPSFLIYNVDLLNSLGLEIDLDNWTWDQFYRLCSKITGDLDGDGTLDRFAVEGYDWHQAFYTNDNVLFNEKSSQVGFNSLYMAQMIEFLKKMHSLNQGMVVREGMFEMGKVGFKTFNFSEFRVYGSYPYRILRYDDFDWKAIPFPHGPHGSSKSKLYTVQLGMSSRSRHKDVAFEFLRLISSDKEFQYMIWDNSNMLPVNRDAFDQIYLSGIMQRDGMRQLDRDFIESVISGSYIDPDFKKYPVIDDYITQRIFKIIAQDEDIAAGISDLKQIINDLLQENTTLQGVNR
ncbi:extracellular solute-binding protein [Sphaerochaeta sp.]|jgi:multiple sugar transport system substrate-binding protein|uniref:extracellular solute-binding protein n=1 Tax=Sphaerochaeta sp. TaxID=1972642 RepID=UPI0016AC5B35|nr:extracellular solute-binding protein [Sphaerochaeta sp.]MDX9984776.1 extracellular solute-binding protein [Sphaerochaeta sp.]NLE14981.1 extracellular solute-binding protein [Spirochaetales bacterium]